MCSMLRPNEVGRSVSVVIPLHNKAAYIKRALDSVLAQTHQDFEVIVVDDGSTDGSEITVERCTDARVRMVRQENAGVSAARNRGIAEAHADLIAFLDADDEWLPTHLDTVMRMRQRYPECGAYATAERIVETGSRSRTRTFPTIPASPWEGIIPSFFRTVLIDGDPVNSSSVAIPKRVLDRIGAFPVGVRRGEDTYMWSRIALRYPIAYSRQVGEVTHREAECRACNGPLPLDNPILEHLEKALAEGRVRAGESLADVAEYTNRLRINHAMSCITAGLPEKARVHLRAATSTKLFSRSRRLLYALTFAPPAMGRLALRGRLRRAKPDSG